MWSNCVSFVKSGRLGGLCCKKIATKSNLFTNHFMGPAAGCCGLKIPFQCFRTSCLLREKDPFEELIRELHLNENNLRNNTAQKLTEQSKMFTQDPPISIKDIDGKPLEPIDINAWADPDELQSLFGNIDFLNKKVLGQSIEFSSIVEPLEIITNIADDESMLTRFKENENTKEEEKQDVNGEKTGEKEGKEHEEGEGEGNKSCEYENHETVKDRYEDTKKTHDEITQILHDIKNKTD